MTTDALRRNAGNALQLIAMGTGVTMLGLLGGAMLVSPAMPRDAVATQLAKIPLELALAAGGVLAAVAVLTMGVRKMATRDMRRPTVPSITLRGDRVSKTPRHVQALAAAGAAPEEIAWKTGLPVDAVSMLLTMSVARQVPPPLA